MRKALHLAIFVLKLSVPVVLFELGTAVRCSADVGTWGGLNIERSGIELPYQADLKAFSPALGPLVAAVDARPASAPEAALPRAEGTQGKAQVPLSDYEQRGIAAAQTLQKTLTRGYQDEIDHLLGILYERAGKPDEALAAYSRSLERHPNNPAVHFRHAYLLRQLGQCAAAAPELNEVSWLSADFQAEVQFIRAQCLLTEGNLREAISTLEAAHKADPALLPVTKLLVRARMAALQRERLASNREALRAQIAADLTTVVQAQPDDHDAAMMLARYRLDHSDPFFDPQGLAEAEKLALRANEKGGYRDEQAVQLLAAIQLKRGNSDAALQSLQKGLKRNPASPNLLASARALEADGNTK